MKKEQSRKEQEAKLQWLLVIFLISCHQLMAPWYAVAAACESIANDMTWYLL